MAVDDCSGGRLSGSRAAADRPGKEGRARANPGGGRALRLLFATAGIAGPAAVAGLVLGPSVAQWSILGCALLAVPLVIQIARGSERSLLGELLVAFTLPALALPVALSGGVPTVTAAGVWLVWTLGFAVATFTVRDIAAHLKRSRPLFLRLGPVAVGALVAGSASVLGLLQRTQVLALTPLLIALLAVAARPPHPRHLRRTGWILLVSSTITAVLLIA